MSDDRPARGLRVVPPADDRPGEPVTMAEAIGALAARVAAAEPSLVMVVYEAPAGKLNVRTIPASPYVAEVLAARVSTMFASVEHDPDSAA